MAGMRPVLAGLDCLGPKMFLMTSNPVKLAKRMADSAFWRFLLDIKKDGDLAAEPRFRAFAENLRNFVVAGAIMRSGALIEAGDATEPSKTAHLLLAVGVVVMLLSGFQLIGLCAWVSSAYLESKLDGGGRRINNVFLVVLILLAITVLPGILLLSMVKFITVTITTLK
jgi:hypothetical protein